MMSPLECCGVVSFVVNLIQRESGAIYKMIWGIPEDQCGHNHSPLKRAQPKLPASVRVSVNVWRLPGQFYWIGIGGGSGHFDSRQSPVEVVPRIAKFWLWRGCDSPWMGDDVKTREHHEERAPRSVLFCAVDADWRQTLPNWQGLI